MDQEHAPDGAFVELDQTKLTRDQLVLLGMKEAHDKWIEELISQAGMVGPGLAPVSMVLREIAGRMTDYRDHLAVVLTKVAVKSGSGTLHNIKAEI
jgi:hypothetical protein